jgi:hypothetical protein
MATALNTLPRPGVQVIQAFRAVTATVITPTLVPCVIGVCKQIVELLESDGAGGQLLNTDALISLPAFFLAKAGTGAVVKKYMGLNGLNLVVSINNSPDITITFSDPAGGGLLPSSVVGQINAAFALVAMTAARAEVVGSDKFWLKTVGTGIFQTIQVQPGTDAVVASTFAVGVGRLYYGLDAYNQYDTVIPPVAFPDPRGNLSELAFEQDSLRVWMSMGTGTSVREASRTSALLRYGTVTGGQAVLLSDASIIDGTVVFPTDVQGETLFVRIDGGEEQSVLVSSNVLTAAQLAAELDAGIVGATVDIVTVAGGDLGKLRITSSTPGGSSRVEITGGTLMGTVAVPIIPFSAGAAVMVGTVDLTTLGYSPGGDLVGLTLILSIDSGASQTVTFTDVISAAAAVAEITAGITGVTASLQAVTNLLVLTSNALGENASISVIGGTALALLGLTVGDLEVGTSPFDDGVAIEAIDDGNGDAVTPLLSFPGNNFTAAATRPSLVGSSVMTSVTDGATLILTDGGQVQTVVFDGATTPALTVDQINAVMGAAAGGKLTATQNAGVVTLQHTEYGEDGYFSLLGGTALAELDPGTAAVSIIGSVDLDSLTLPGDVQGLTLQVSVNGGAVQTCTFTAASVSVPTFLGEINAAILGTTASQSGLLGLIFTTTATGHGASVRIVGGTAMNVLGLFEHTRTGGSTIYAGAVGTGVAHPPLPGDILYIDGVPYGTVLKVNPTGVNSVLKIDKSVVIGDVGARFWIQAMNLTDAVSNLTRPFPEMILDLNNNITVKDGIVRDAVSGARITVNSSMYISYTALRRDVTALAAQQGLLRFDDTVALDNALSPVSASNPLALGLFYALINAPSAQVTGLGVDAISADMPDGTLEAYVRAAEFIEAYEVYAIAPLTHDETVAQVFNTHVNFMSEPTQRGERIVMWNPSVPTRDIDTLVASGSVGEATNTFTFNTGVGNLAALLQNAGIDPMQPVIAVSSGLFLDVSADDKRYSIKSVSGQQITVRITPAEFLSGENDDDFYAEDVLPLPLVGELFSIRIRGRELVTVDGTRDKQAIAETMNKMGQGYSNRRFWMTFPDKCRASIEGLEQLIDGYYMNAAVAGCIGQQPPQQSFTNFPVAGFTGVVGSNDSFSEAQLDIMAGGGTWIFIQEGTGTPIFARMAVTTDQTSIETRTDSVTKVVDFTAKFLRKGIRNFIGRFNITQGFLDSLGTTVQGMFGFLVEHGVLIGGNLDNIIQDENNRDTVLIDTTLDVPIPCNYVKLTLLV